MAELLITINKQGKKECTVRAHKGHIWELLTDGTWRNIVSKEVVTKLA